MATPRKHWFKVPDAVLFEDWSDEQLAILIRLQAYLNVQWARGGKTDAERGSAVLRPAEMTLVTGRKRADNAAVALRKLAGISDLTIELTNGSAVINWPKYAEFQQTQPEKRPERALSGSGSGSGSISKKQEIGGGESAPSAPPAPRARRAKMRAPCPDALDDSEWTRVLAWAAKEGVPLADVVREWDAMRDYWRGKGELRADWSASFRTWLRNAKRFAERDRRDGGMSPAQAKAERTKEAGRQAYELIQQRKLGLIEGGAA